MIFVGLQLRKSVGSVREGKWEPGSKVSIRVDHITAVYEAKDGSIVALLNGELENILQPREEVVSLILKACESRNP